MTPRVSPSIKSSNSGRMARMTGPIWRITSPTIGTPTATSRNVPTVGAAVSEPAEVGPQDGETYGEGAGQQESQPGDEDRLVLPHVHVVEIDDVDDRHRKGG